MRWLASCNLRCAIGRALTAVPGIVLFVCLFLPGAPDGKILWSYLPYLLGLVVGLAATPIPMHALAIAIRVVLFPTLGLVVVISVVLAFFFPPLVLPAVPCVLVFKAVGTGCDDEPAALRGALASAALLVVWSLLHLAEANDQYGAYVASAASFAMFAGALKWRADTVWFRSPE